MPESKLMGQIVDHLTLYPETQAVLLSKLQYVRICLEQGEKPGHFRIGKKMGTFMGIPVIGVE